MKLTQNNDRAEEQNLEEARPPILGSWPRIYLLVLGVLGSLMVLFSLFTRNFS